MLQMTYDYWGANDRNALALDRRIAESLKSPQNENDHITFKDGKKFCNEQELRKALEEKGGILCGLFL